MVTSLVRGDRSQQAEPEPSPGLHASKCGLPPNMATTCPIEASVGPRMGLPYMSPSSSPHIMLYILKTNHLCTVDRTVVTKS